MSYYMIKQICDVHLYLFFNFKIAKLLMCENLFQTIPYGV